MEQPVQEETLAWFAWGAQHQPYRAGFAALTMIVGIILCNQINTVFAVAMAIAMLYALGEVLLPIRYQIDARGVSVLSFTQLGRKKWASFQAWEKRKKGFLLIGKGKYPILIQRRSLMLYCFCSQDKVQEKIESYFGARE